MSDTLSFAKRIEEAREQLAKLKEERIADAEKVAHNIAEALTVQIEEQVKTLGPSDTRTVFYNITTEEVECFRLAYNRFDPEVAFNRILKEVSNLLEDTTDYTDNKDLKPPVSLVDAEYNLVKYNW